MIKVGIIGASGYTGGELVRLLLRHPHVEISCISSRTYEGKHIGEVFPSLYKNTDLVFENLQPHEVAERSDVVFTAVPHGAAMDVAQATLGFEGRKMIDLGADFRLRDAAVYEAWYGKEHTARGLLVEAVYGLPEFHREEIKKARLVANPGCYPTSSILGLAPLLKSHVIDPSTVIIDAKSGVSGAGRSPGLNYHFPECNEGLKPYSVPGHRHIPEIEQELSWVTGRDVKISFTPHLIPMTRGLLTTTYAVLTKGLDTESATSLLREFYAKEPFVRVLDKDLLPQTKAVSGSNFCDIALRVDSRTGRVVVMSAIDNLIKGAAGQAVQNMNLMFGFIEGAGLDFPGMFP